ncbi:MAG: hypothetical protein V7687_16815 [Maribacter arcticus]|uniref:hypothetical protein n=1 Tax=Maribacter arcticus TaxID=561365 RepID=UPI003000FE8F
MKKIPKILILVILTFFTLSCEPEELSMMKNTSDSDIFADSEHDGEVEDRKGNT